MKSRFLILLQIFVIQHLVALGASQSFDFFYFVLEWPESYCDSAYGGCCTPTSGKPAADFGIVGLWPTKKDGSFQTYCDSNNGFDLSSVSDIEVELQKYWPSVGCPADDGTRFWKYVWEKHGTCSESSLAQRGYFQAALSLKKKVDALSLLALAGIKPNGGFYKVSSIKRAIEFGTGFTPGVGCNVDRETGASQLYQLYICVDKYGENLIECPKILDQGRCNYKIKFPVFTLGDNKVPSKEGFISSVVV